VAILDADKEGFLRSAGSLIQTIGRAARHINGRAVLYADRMTDSMAQAMEETARRRQTQTQYNKDNGITPQSIIKPIDMSLARIVEADYAAVPSIEEAEQLPASAEDRLKLIEKLEGQMRESAKRFEFEKAAHLRDRVKALKTGELTGPVAG
jgi:excinuclease ABC subunit B